MKRLIFTLLLFSSHPLFCQVIVPVSSTAIADIKIDMTLAQVEKIIGQTLTLKKTTEEGYALDTTLVNHKGIPLKIEFYSTTDDNNQPIRRVYAIGASHPSLQTRSGITIGSDKFEIVKKLDGMHLSIQPDWRYDTKTDKTKYSVLILNDGDNSTQLLMYFTDNKLTGFYVSLFEGC